MYRLSKNIRKYSATPLVKVEIEKDKEKETPVLYSAFSKKEGEAFLQKIADFLNKENS